MLWAGIAPRRTTFPTTAGGGVDDRRHDRVEVPKVCGDSTFLLTASSPNHESPPAGTEVNNGRLYLVRYASKGVPSSHRNALRSVHDARDGGPNGLPPFGTPRRHSFANRLAFLQMYTFRSAMHRTFWTSRSPVFVFCHP